ncbi:hypothetical protein BpHYR1_022231 [Brachionus plicatilis]|uniref:Uncharacterized protein n=1 Tax=Brachionus plicatilis TaxID=10195 RepID=A0A3M7SA93_BRAPC|nr:hypothetical protein BpHYR1_022231 [Brachionus plicatilis]
MLTIFYNALRSKKREKSDSQSLTYSNFPTNTLSSSFSGIVECNSHHSFNSFILQFLLLSIETELMMYCIWLSVGGCIPSLIKFFFMLLLV